jgi:RecA-family ATPase
MTAPILASQAHKFDVPVVAPFERHPLDWRTLADGEPPAREWVIEFWLGMAFVTLLAGLGGIGKTLLGQMIGSASAVGRDYVGKIAAPRRVLMWAAEDDHNELWRRQVAIAAHFGVGLGEFAGKFIVKSYADRDCTVMDLDLGGRLVHTGMYDELREQIHDYRAEVVILDHAARLFGGKESDRNHVTRFVAALNAAAGGAAILLLAHPGRALGSEYSGSSAWENAARARLYLADRKPDAKVFDEDDEAPTDGRRYLAKRKTNYSSRDLRAFRYENGVLVPEQPMDVGGFVGAISDRNDERVVLDAFERLRNGLGQQPTDGDNSPNFLPTLALKFGLADGRTKRDLAQAMRRLMVDGKLKREAIGKYANRNPRFGLVMTDAPNP